MNSPAPLTKQQKDALAQALLEAIRRKDIAMVEGSLKMGADAAEPINNGRSSLHWAMTKENFSQPVVEILLRNVPTVDARDGSSHTPLMTALNENNLDAVCFLLKKGADPLAQNREGRVALEMARGKEDKRFLQLLLTIQPDPKTAADDFNSAVTKEDMKIEPPFKLKDSPKKDGGIDL